MFDLAVEMEFLSTQYRTRTLLCETDITKIIQTREKLAEFNRIFDVGFVLVNFVDFIYVVLYATPVDDL